MLIKGLVSKLVQLAGTYVMLELLIPASGVEFGEPLAELLQLVGRELRDGRFDFIECAHTRILVRVPSSVNGGPLLFARRIRTPDADGRNKHNTQQRQQRESEHGDGLLRSL
jgi:hypothetical protein